MIKISSILVATSVLVQPSCGINNETKNPIDNRKNFANEGPSTGIKNTGVVESSVIAYETSLLPLRSLKRYATTHLKGFFVPILTKKLKTTDQLELYCAHSNPRQKAKPHGYVM